MDTKSHPSDTKAQRALDLASELGLDASDFAELAMLALDQAGVSIEHQRLVLREVASKRMRLPVWHRWRDELLVTQGILDRVLARRGAK